jgi:PAS domain S-box-containing protein
LRGDAGGGPAARVLRNEQVEAHARWSTPIVGADGTVLAVLDVDLGERRSPTQHEQAVIGSAANLAGTAILKTQLEGALRRERELLDTILESIDAGIVVCDASGALTRFNRQAREFHGRPPEPVPPEAWAAHYGLHVPDGSRLLRVEEVPLYRAYRGELVRDAEMMIRSPGGAAHLVLCTCQPMRAPDGTELGAVCLMYDITARKHQEEALRHTQKLESIGVLASGIAHDFNNLLTGVIGNITLARRALAPDSLRAQPMLDDALRASERAADLTKQLLAYAGGGRYVMRPVDMSTLVKETADLLRLSVPRQVTLAVDAPGDCPPVRGDATQLQQVVMNLVINAAESMEGRTGVVAIRTDDQELDTDALRRFRPPDRPAGRYVRITVRDQGVGMDPGSRDRIFDPFFTTKFLGRGLGLSAVQGIVQGHHGAIAVDSVPGRGTTMEVVLPTAVAPAPAPAPARGPAVPERGRGGTECIVLVVDDEASVRQVARITLEEAGHEVLLAEHGEAAVELLRRHAERIGVVLLDLTMPVLSGPETAEALRRIRPDLPILVTTGYAEQQAREQFGALSIQGLVPKPFTADALLEAVTRAVEAGPPCD